MTAPITGFSHIQFLVRDVEVSQRWYSQVLGMEPLVAADDGTYVALRHRPSKVVIVLTAAAGAPDAGSIGLDHLAFAVPDGATLAQWAIELTEHGIDHAGVELELGKPSLKLMDPDGIQIELVAPPPPGR